MTTQTMQTLGEFMTRCKPNTVLDIFFKTANGEDTIPPELSDRPTAQQLLDNTYLNGLTIDHRDHFANIRISSGWNIYINQEFDQKAFTGNAN